MPKNRRPSIEDIAKEAGVSTATVSRVLNNSDKVRPETADRVLEAKIKLNYHPDRVARRMRVKNSDSLLIGLILTDIGNPFFSELSRGVEDVAYENQNAVLICNTDENAKKERFYIDSMLAERATGLIIAPSSGNIEYLKQLITDQVAVVCVDRYPNGVEIDSVTVNNEKGAWLATRRLINRGHKNIALVNGIEGLSTTAERFIGYKRAHREAELPLREELILNMNYKESGGREAMRALLALKNPPTAVFSTNNLMTLGCFAEMHDQGIDIPGDIAIIGFDDMSWSAALNPPLTAVRQPAYRLGQQAVKLLLQRIAEPESNTIRLSLNPELVVRESCGLEI